MEGRNSLETCGNDQEDDINKKSTKYNKEKYVEVELNPFEISSSAETDAKIGASKPSKFKRYWKFFLPLCLLLGFNWLYYMTQEDCPYNIDENPVICIDFFKNSISKWAVQSILSAVCWLALVYLAIKRVYSRIWIPVAFTNYIIMYLMFQGSSMEHHGSINRFVLTMWLVMLTLIFILIM